MTAFDSNYLLELARERSAASRSELAATVTDLFSGDGDQLTDRERALMFEILHRIVKDAEMEVRKVISSRLADRTDAPNELLALLGNDDIEVAYPILTESTVLRDQSLIEIVRNRTLEHQMAVAIRHSVSEDVTDALIETGDERVIKTLLQNENANISNATMEFLVEQSQRVDSFQEPILLRKELQPEMAKRMYMWVSAALRKYIIANSGISLSDIDDLIEDAVIETVGDRRGEEANITKSERLADELSKDGKISPDLMIRALQDGEVKLFVNLMSKGTHLREELVMRFVLEPGGEGLAVACKALNLSDYEYQRVYTYCRKARPNKESETEKSVETAIRFFRNVNKESAYEVVKRWRRDKNYLSALRDLDVI
ncbi:MAG: DUF2336 domain-containing protein [Rhodospirillales bacterium]|nr:DUF2336 domain-containing protein [Rhodospirillales bacterium]